MAARNANGPEEILRGLLGLRPRVIERYRGEDSIVHTGTEFEWLRPRLGESFNVVKMKAERTRRA